MGGTYGTGENELAQLDAKHNAYAEEMEKIKQMLDNWDWNVDRLSFRKESVSEID